jgi:hypothetical protein
VMSGVDNMANEAACRFQGLGLCTTRVRLSDLSLVVPFNDKRHPVSDEEGNRSRIEWLVTTKGKNLREMCWGLTLVGAPL